MTLSQNARKGLAIGLAASTVLMSAMTGLIPAAFAAPHADGCNVLSNGTVYYVLGGQLRGFPSAEVFTSWGNGFGGVQQATAEDLALPRGPVMVYADGTLVKGPNDPLVYLVSNGQKRGFTTGAVFTGRGFKFSNIQSAPANTFADLPTGANIDNTTERHSAGVWVIDSTGTVWRMTATGRVGLPSMAVFNSWGKSFSTVVAANAADLTANNEGVAQAKPSCSSGSNPPPTSGPLSVSLAGDSPASGTIVQGQATALLAKFVFSGSGQVNQIQLQRTGISTDTALTGVYLFDGGTRLTDASSVVSGSLINFNSSAGLFTVNGSRTISVRADVWSSAAAGSTVGVKMNSYTASGSSMTAVGLSGNLMNVSAVATTSLSLAVNGVSSQNVNAPATNLTLWSSALSGNTRIVKLDAVNFKFVGSAPYDALQNLKLYFNGNQVGSATTVNSLGYIVFDLTGAPYSIQSGGGTLELRGDVVKGSNRNFTISLAGTYDLMVEDSNFSGVNITAGGTIPNGTAVFSVQAGTVTSSLDSTFNTTNTVTGGTTNVALARYKLQAYGEDVKITSLAVLPVLTSMTPSAAGLSNVTLYANGQQIGTVQNWTQGNPALTFNLGSQLTVPAAGSSLIEIHADTMTSAGVNYTAGTIQFTLTGAASNAQGLSSSNVFQVNPNLTSTGITIGSGGATVAANTALLSQTIAPNAANIKIGSFVVQAGSAESLRVSNLKVDLTFGGTAGTYASGTVITGSHQITVTGSTVNFAVGDVITIPGATAAIGTVTSVDSPTTFTANFTTGGVTPAGVVTGTSGPQTTNNLTNFHTSENATPVTTASSMNFPVSFTLAANATKTIDVFADLGSNAAGTVQTSLTLTSVGATSNTTVLQNGNGTAVTGQVFTIANGSLATPTKVGAPASPVTQFAVGGMTGVNGNNNPAMTLNFVASNGTASIQEMKFAITGSNTVNSITVNGVNAPVVSGTADLVFSSAIQVPVGFAGTNVAVVPTYNTVGLGGLTSNTASTITLNYVKSQVGNAAPVITTPSVASSAFNLVASKPSLAMGATTTSTSSTRSGLANGLVKLADVTVSANAAGNIKVEQLPIVTNSTGVATVATGTNNLVVKDESGATQTTTNGTFVVAAGGTSGSVAIVFTTPVTVSAGTSKTFSIYATAATVSGASNTTSFTTSLGTNSSFTWTDVNGNLAGITGALIYNYPTETSTITN